MWVKRARRSWPSEKVVGAVARCPGSEDYRQQQRAYSEQGWPLSIASVRSPEVCDDAGKRQQPWGTSVGSASKAGAFNATFSEEWANPSAGHVTHHYLSALLTDQVPKTAEPNALVYLISDQTGRRVLCCVVEGRMAILRKRPLLCECECI